MNYMVFLDEDSFSEMRPKLYQDQPPELQMFSIISLYGTTTKQ